MTPLPKRRYAKARQGKRRSHLQWSPPAAESCPHCHNLKLAHSICSKCGYYNGREVVSSKVPKKK
ncbi:MAG: 50S ribosomal protein L32 [Chloroflexota bacterium]|nr:50S ribosomal protein L32 [Chloroflexota bacterium]